MYFQVHSDNSSYKGSHILQQATACGRAGMYMAPSVDSRAPYLTLQHPEPWRPQHSHSVLYDRIPWKSCSTFPCFQIRGISVVLLHPDVVASVFILVHISTPFYGHGPPLSPCSYKRYSRSLHREIFRGLACPKRSCENAYTKCNRLFP